MSNAPPISNNNFVPWSEVREHFEVFGPDEWAQLSVENVGTLPDLPECTFKKWTEMADESTCISRASFIVLYLPPGASVVNVLESDLVSTFGHLPTLDTLNECAPPLEKGRVTFISGHALENTTALPEGANYPDALDMVVLTALTHAGLVNNEMKFFLRDFQAQTTTEFINSFGLKSMLGVDYKRETTFNPDAVPTWKISLHYSTPSDSIFAVDHLECA